MAKKKDLELDNTPFTTYTSEQEEEQTTTPSSPAAQTTTASPSTTGATATPPVQPQPASQNNLTHAAQTAVANAATDPVYQARTSVASMAQQQASKPAQQVAAPAPSRAVTSLLDQVNAYVTEYGTMPSDDEIANMTAGKRWQLMKAMRDSGAKVDLSTNGVRSWLTEQNRKYQQQQTAAMFNPSGKFQRDEKGNLTVPEGTATWDLGNGSRATKQDMEVLNSWMKQPASPERDAAIAQVLGWMGVHLPTTGTLEQRINAYIAEPEKYESADSNPKARADALAFILEQSGATSDDNGNVVLPRLLNGNDIEAKLAEYDKKQRQELQRQQAEINNRRRRMGYASLASIFGDMIKASGGAKVFPNDNQAKDYDGLNERQQKLYDAYVARVEAERQRLAQQKAKEDEAAQARAFAAAEAEKARRAKADEAQKDRDLQERITAARIAGDRNVAFIRSNAYGNKKEQDEYYLNFGYGTEPISMKKAEGESVYEKIYGEMVDWGIIPADKIPADVKIDKNGQIVAADRTAAVKEIAVLINQYWKRLSKQQLEHLYFIATGKTHKFRTEDEVRADMNPSSYPMPEPDNRANLVPIPNEVDSQEQQSQQQTTDWSNYFE